MKTLLSGKAYEILKWLAILALPAIADFIKFLFPTWNIPFGDPIAETIRQVALLIGILIGISTIDYNKKINAELSDIKEDLGE
ncbi:MAG: hypothetical protein IKF90_11125 [Parasporobacterium sp.]|nr:hypothetical protein [Parasporobacterium sp.]